MPRDRYTPSNLEDFRKKFPSDAACYDYLFLLRERMPFDCARCHQHKWRPMRRRVTPSWTKAFRECKNCGFQESATTATMLHGSHMSAKDWLQVFWWAAATDGLSASQFANETGTALNICFASQATTYGCLDRIRRLMTDFPKLEGEVRLGVVHAGQKDSGLRYGKKLVCVAVCSHGKEAKLGLLSDLTPSEISSFAVNAIKEGSEIVTSGWKGYGCLAKLHYRHTNTPPRFESLDSTDPNLLKLESNLQKWLSRIGWERITQANLGGFLEEFGFRYRHARKGGTVGFLFKTLVQMALSQRSKRPAKPISPGLPVGTTMQRSC